MATWTLTQQRDTMLAWAVSEVGSAAAQRLARKYGLNNEADDLVSMTLEKITRSFARRPEPLPDVGNVDQAIRYAYRAMANIAIDLARRKRQESKALVSVARITPTQPGTDQSATSQVFIEELFSALHRVTSSGFTCKACNDRVTYAAATEVLHLALLEGSDAAVGQSWLDDVIYSVVDRYEIGMSRSAAAQRQRRSRCRRCVMELLQAALSAIGVRRG
jgi:hypothetical protein